MSEGENEQIIKLISQHTKVLLQNHWADITDFRNGGESIKIGFSHDVGYEGQKRIVESTISFGKRVKDSTIDRLDTEQLGLDLTDKPAKRTRGRPKKTNIVQAAILSGPAEPETDE